MKTEEIAVDSIANLLFRDPTLHAYAVLDGAANELLLDRLFEDEPDFVCLYRGKLEPDLAQCAPYLVQLERDSDLLAWLIGEGWGNHWGIYAVSDADLKTMRRHFRKFLMVTDPEGKQLYFRYYDPRVLRTYLPTCNAEERQTLFGPIKSYLLENAPSTSALEFAMDKEPPREIPLASQEIA